MRMLALLLITTCSMACTMSAVPSDGITLTALRNDDHVRLTLHNESGGPIGYNLCTSALQRKLSDGWDPVETGDICTMEIRTLANAQSATFDKTVPEDTSAGEYRYVTNVDVNGNRVVVESAPFPLP